MFNRLPGIGLDIGSQKIKMIQLKKRKSGLEIIKFGSISTPPDTVDSGFIYDPERLGADIKILVKKLHLSGKRVVSAVGGQQMYIRNLIMPRLKLDELKTAVHYQATEFLPVPAEDTAIDIHPLRDFEELGIKKTEVFFLAVRKQQVENLEAACLIAGLKLAAVEIEPLSLLRAWGKDTGAEIALLAICASRSYFTVFNRGVPVFYRSLAAGNFSFDYHSSLTAANQVREAEPYHEQNNQLNEPWMANIIAEVKAALEYYQLQAKRPPGSIRKVLLGGGEYVPCLQEGLSQTLGLEAEIINILAGNTLPRDISREEEYELQHEFLLALGLAAREVV